MYLSDIQSARVEVLGLFSASLAYGAGGVADEGNLLYQSVDTTGVGRGERGERTCMHTRTQT